MIEGEPLEIGLADPGRRYTASGPNESNEKKERGKEKKLIGCIESFYRVGPVKGIGWDCASCSRLC